MPYKLTITEKEALDKKDKFKNEKGHAECVKFVRQATNAPSTTTWQMGAKVAGAKLGEIQRETALAAFGSMPIYKVSDFY